MRTIDADALRDKFQNLAYDDWNQGVVTSWANAYNECADIVDDMPTIEQQRMRGRWIKLYEGNYKCSECGDWWGNDDNDMVENFRFCPNCGADMRGEQE